MKPSQATTPVSSQNSSRRPRRLLREQSRTLIHPCSADAPYAVATAPPPLLPLPPLMRRSAPLATDVSRDEARRGLMMLTQKALKSQKCAAAPNNIALCLPTNPACAGLQTHSPASCLSSGKSVLTVSVKIARVCPLPISPVSSFSTIILPCASKALFGAVRANPSCTKE